MNEAFEKWYTGDKYIDIARAAFEAGWTMGRVEMGKQLTGVRTSPPPIPPPVYPPPRARHG